MPGERAASLLIVTTVAPTIRNFLLPYAAHFRALGWRVDAAASGALKDEAVRTAFDHVYELPLSRSILDVQGNARAFCELSTILGATHADIVHAHTPIAGFVTRLAARRMPPARRPAVVYTAHGFHFHEGGNPMLNAAFLTAERVAGRWTDRLVVINDEDEAAARTHRIVPARRLVRMPGIGVDTARYSRSSVVPAEIARTRRDLGIPEGAPLFTVVAEHAPRKRVGDAIVALGAMRHREAHLALAGDGPERPRLEALASASGLDGRVHFLGSLADVRPLVCAAAALVLPSEREGLARSVMEALSLEVPVIASTARGNAELVGADRGFLVAISDVRALAGAMDRMIDDPDDRQRMGERGRALMVERYDQAVLLRLHEALYADVLGARISRGD